jgi:nicotinamide-nucleotide amidase
VSPWSDKPESQLVSSTRIFIDQKTAIPGGFLIKSKSIMPSAEIITIGTEILLGEILDTNARHIAQQLRQTGIDLYRKTTVGDNINRISQIIREAFDRCEIIITTGGLGPTVDDPTREAVAQAFGVELEFRPELWEQIQARFRRYNRQPTENNRRQAFIPQGALAIENPVGTAPAFMIEKREKCIISLPGVPGEMQYLLQQLVLPYLRSRYQINTVIKTRTLHTSGAGESQIDALIGDLESLSNPTIGLAAHAGQVDVRITAKAESDGQADDLIAEVETQLRDRLEQWIYGVDTETLEERAMQALHSRGWSLVVVETGSNGELTQRLARHESAAFRGGTIIGKRFTPEELLEITNQYRQSQQADVGLGLLVLPGPEQQQVHLALITPEDQQEYYRPYGGQPENAPHWAANFSLDLIRKL